MVHLYNTEEIGGFKLSYELKAFCCQADINSFYGIKKERKKTTT